jgi:hypothetical protein
VVLVSLLLALAGCDRFPRDSAGALERIEREHVVRVGVVDHPPWVRLGGARPSGVEPALVEAWAAEQGARVAWRSGDLDGLVQALHRRELDVLLAGLDAKSPYGRKAALSQVYVTVKDASGKAEKHVMAVTQGENALLLSLDRFLKRQDEAAIRRAAGASAP